MSLWSASIPSTVYFELIAMGDGVLDTGAVSMRLLRAALTRGGRAARFAQARDGTAYLWCRLAGQSGRPLATALGVSHRAGSAAATRGERTVARWAGVWWALPQFRLGEPRALPGDTRSVTGPGVPLFRIQHFAASGCGARERVTRIMSGLRSRKHISSGAQP